MTVLGIDTGGTFTDAVILDTGSGKVMQKSKSQTVKQDLSIGISNCIEMMDIHEDNDISRVHLSSTLATNCILENTFRSTGLIVLGKHIQEKIPVTEKLEIIKILDEKKRFLFENSSTALTETISKIKKMTEDVEVLIISAFGSDYKEYEIKAASSLKRHLDIEIICSNEINNDDDFYKRTLTASTNVGLSTIIDDLVKMVHKTLVQKGITAPLFFLASDGSLVSTQTAVDDPVSTLCSGPAASAIGSKHLTDLNDYLLLDMGGTSVDITKVEDRKLRMMKQKGDLGGYEYELESLDIQSYGIGGDSEIRLNSMGDIVVGPHKVTPLCTAGQQNKHLIEELDEYTIPLGYDLCTARETDCYMLTYKKDYSRLNEREGSIIDVVDEKPHSLFYISEKLGVDADSLRMDQLMDKGYVKCFSLTPTDILHVENRFNRWDRDIAVAGAKQMAKRLDWSFERFLHRVNELITNRIVFSCMQSIARFENISFDFLDSKATMYLIEKYLFNEAGFCSVAFGIRKPIVAVGAPAAAWTGSVAEKLQAELVIPEDGDVAGAIGAAIGKV